MYSIEDLIEQIPEYKTKDLFKDIYSLYTQKQYRATVVMLWTVVICDLIYKLQYLENLYSDETAQNILKDIQNFQVKNPRNPEWEKTLVEKIEERTELLSKIDKENLEYLQKQRNLCAHPVITEDKLFQPSKDLTRSLIRLALESILIKSPLLVKNYINTIVEDFAKRQDDFFLDEEKAIKYFESKYLKHLNITQTLKLFRTLWKFVFKAHTQQEEQNIYINEVLLSYLIQKHKSECIEEIKANTDFYTFDNKSKIVNPIFYYFIIKNYFLFELFSDHTKALIENEYQSFPKNIPCSFFSDSFEEHIAKLKQDYNKRTENMPRIEDIQITNLYEKAKIYDELEIFYTLCIEWYSKSWCYDEADYFFKILINPYYKNFNLELLILLINLTASNYQTFERRKARQEHKLIAKQFVEKGGTIEQIQTQWSDWDELIKEVV